MIFKVTILNIKKVRPLFDFAVHIRKSTSYDKITTIFYQGVIMWDKLANGLRWAIIIAIASFICFGMSHDRKIEWLENIFLIILFIDVFIILPLIIIIKTVKKIKTSLPKAKPPHKQSDLMKYLTKNDHLKNETIGSTNDKNKESRGWELISESERYTDSPRLDTEIQLSVSVKHRSINVEPTYDYSAQAVKSYINMLKISKIFIPEAIPEIEQTINGYINYSLHNTGELLSNEEKKELGITYRGHLSKFFYNSLKDKTDIKYAIETYQDIQKDSLGEYFRLKEEDQFYFLAKHRRQESIDNGYTVAAWSCLKSYNCPHEHHRELNRKRFNIVEGMIDPEFNSDSIRIFPGEQSGCKCRISEFIR